MTVFSTPAYFTTPEGDYLAYHYHASEQQSSPCVVFLSGFMSDMQGSKALFLEALCKERDMAFLRFDYHGHGQSDGEFAEGTLSRWVQNAIDLLNAKTHGPLLLVGSSMGGWIMLHVALAMASRIAGLVGIAAAPDFTERLMWQDMKAKQRAQLMDEGMVYVPSDYGYDPYPITRELIEDGRNCLMLDKAIEINCPVRLLHGMQDTDVPWSYAQKLADRLVSQDVQIRYVTDAEHRFSRQEDLALLADTVLKLHASTRK